MIPLSERLGRRGRSRSPRRTQSYYSGDEDTRRYTRSRSREPRYRRGDSPIREVARSRGRQNPRPRRADILPIFEPIRFHYYSAGPGVARVARDHCDELTMRGARGFGFSNLRYADMIIMPPGEVGKHQQVRPPMPKRTLEECYRLGFTANEIYHHFASRSNPDLDSLKRSRKRVIQAEWIDESITLGRMLWGPDMCGYEIVVDNTSSASRSGQRQQQVSSPMAARAPTTQYPVPELDFTLPNVTQESRPAADANARRVTTPAMDPPVQGDIIMSNADTSAIDVQTTSTPAPSQNTLLSDPIATASGQIASEDDSKPDVHALQLSLGSIRQDRWRPSPRMDLNCRNNAESLERPVKQEVTSSPFHNLIVPTTAQPANLMLGAPSMRETIATGTGMVESTAASTSAFSTSVDITPPMPLAEASTETATLPNRSNSLEGDGAKVFVRDQIMIPTFHVIDIETNQVAVMLITQFGGGKIVPMSEAGFLIFPAEGIRQVTDSEHIRIVNERGPNQAVVSIDWIAQCLKDNDRLGWRPYQITAVTLDDQVRDNSGTSSERLNSTSTTSHQATEQPAAGTDSAQGQPQQSGEDDGDDDDVIFISSTKGDSARATPLHNLNRAGMPTPPWTPATPLDIPAGDQHETRIGSEDRASTLGPNSENEESEIDFDDDDETYIEGNGEEDIEGDQNENIEVPASASTSREPVRVAYVSDPQQRREVIKNAGVRTSQRWRFDTMLAELEKWGKTEFKGSFEQLYGRLNSKYGDHKWKRVYHNYKLVYFQLVQKLQFKGRPSARGVRS